MKTAADLFARMPETFDAAKAGNMEATVQFDLSGDGGGQWHVNIANGACAVGEGVTAAPTATIRMDAPDYVKMIKGELNPVTAFMMGQIKVEGDLNTVMKFQTLFG